MPIGTELTAAAIWKAATDEKLMPAEAAAKIDSNKAYLYGSVKGDKFDPVKFEAAAKVLEELTAPPVTPPAGS